MSDFIAVDVGSSRIKLGWYPAGEPRRIILPGRNGVPSPARACSIAYGDAADADWLAAVAAAIDAQSASGGRIVIGSVRPEVERKLRNGPLDRPGWSVTSIDRTRLPLKVCVDEPGAVGVDRLLNAVGINEFRTASQPAIIVDAGTAVTIDLIGADGAFQGGAILPGTGAAACGLASTTAALPALRVEVTEPPRSVVGKSTLDAISVGVVWGLIGAVNEIVMRMAAASQSQSPARPQVVFTGGDAEWLAPQVCIGELPVALVENLTLTGIWAGARHAP